MPASIRSLRNGLSPIVGASRDDLTVGDVVLLQSATAETTYAWTLAYKPAGSTATFSGVAVNPSPGSFTVDKEGSYLIRLTVNAGTGTETTQFVRLRYLTQFGQLKLVAAGEQYGSAVPVPVDATPTGWADAQNGNLLALLSLVQEGTPSGNVVYVDPVNGSYQTIQAALDWAQAQSPSSSDPWEVLVFPGTYAEDLTLYPFVNLRAVSGSVAVETVALPHSLVLLPGEQVEVEGILFFSSLATSNEVFLATGGGVVRFLECEFSVQGGDPLQGPALKGAGGVSLLVDSSRFHMVGAGANQAAVVAVDPGTTLQFTRSLLNGVSGLNLGEGTFCRVTDSSLNTSGTFGILSDAQVLEVQFSELSDLLVHPSGAPLAGNLSVVLHYTRITGALLFDVAGVGGVASLSMGAVEHGTLTYPSGAPALSPLVDADTIAYDNTTTGLPASSAQGAVDALFAYASYVRTLDDAYSGGLGVGGLGRTIIADSGAVQIVDASVPSPVPPPGNTDGSLQVSGFIQLGAIGSPEITLDPNPWGNGPVVSLGGEVWALSAPHGSSAYLLGASTGDSSYRNYTLRVGTQSAVGGGEVGWLVLRGGDGLSNGVAPTPDAAPVHIIAGSAYDAAGGTAGDIFLVPGYSDFTGAASSLVFVDPTTATPAAVTAAGAFLGGVTGVARFATDVGGFTVSIDAADNLPAVLGKFNLTGQVIATQIAGVITLTTVSRGPTAEVFFSAADAGLDVALGTFQGQVQVDGIYTDTIEAQVTGAQEISFGVNGLTGPLIYNADTGKLTVPGLIDPTGLIFEEAPPPPTGSTEGAIFVSDGTDPLAPTAGELYFRPASNGVPVSISTGGGGAGSTLLQDKYVSTAATVGPRQQVFVYGEFSVDLGADLNISQDGELVIYESQGSSGVSFPSAAQYVVLAADATLSDERVLTQGTGITITDGGAGNPVTVALETLAPDPTGTYAYPSSVVVDGKGRVTSVVAGSAPLASGWADGGATVYLTAATDVVSIGNNTPVTGRKFSLENTGTNLGVRVSTLASSDNVLDTLSLNGAGPADVSVRFSLNGEGAQLWGSGAAAQDLRLYRSGSKSLQIDDGSGSSVKLTVKGTLSSQARTHRRVSKTFADTPYSFGDVDEVLFYDATGGNSAAVLPDATAWDGRTVIVKRTDTSANTLTLTSAAGNIEGGVSFIIAGGASRFSYTFCSDGTDWWVI
jgi:hypothetical protein